MPTAPKDAREIYPKFQGSDLLIPPGSGGEAVWIPPSLNWRVLWKLGNPLLSRALERQIFFGKENGVALSTQQTIFLVPSQGLGGEGEGEKKARKKGKLNPHVLSLLKGPDSKPETKPRLQF